MLLGPHLQWVPLLAEASGTSLAQLPPSANSCARQSRRVGSDADDLGWVSYHVGNVCSWPPNLSRLSCMSHDHSPVGHLLTIFSAECCKNCLFVYSHLAVIHYIDRSCSHCRCWVRVVHDGSQISQVTSLSMCLQVIAFGQTLTLGVY